MTVNDTIDDTVVTLSDVTVDEGSGTATISATITNPPIDGPLVLTLSNGATITFEVGGPTTVNSTPFAIQGDDPYIDEESYTVSITGVSGGEEFENLDTTDTATVTVNDTIDDTHLSLGNVTVTEGDSYTIRVYIDNAPLSDLAFELLVGGVKLADGLFDPESLSQDGEGGPYYVDIDLVMPRQDHLGTEDEKIDWTVDLKVTKGGEEFENLVPKQGTITILDTVPEVSVISPGDILIDNEAGATLSGFYTLDIGQDVQSLASSLNLVWVNEFGDYNIAKEANEDGSVTFTASKGTSDLFEVTFSALNDDGDGSYVFTLLQPKPGEIGSVANLFNFLGNNNSPKEFEDIAADASFVDSDGNIVSFSNGLFGLRIDGGEVNGNEINHALYYQGNTDDAVDKDVKVKVSNTDLGVGSNTVQSSQNQYLLFDVRETGNAEIEFTELTIGVARTAGFTPGETQVRVTVFYKDESTSSVTQVIESGGRTDGGGLLVVDLEESGKAVDYFTVEALNGNFKIDAFGYQYQVIVDPDDYEYIFTLTATDSDGDIASSEQFSIQVDGNGDTVFTAPESDLASQSVEVTPIAIDLDGDGSISYLSADAGVTFDYGWGLVATAWVAASDGLLVFDYDGSIYAYSGDGLQLSAENIVLTLWADGASTDMEALALFFDTSGDGIFNAEDAYWSSFGVWQDLNEDGLVDAGEFQTLDYYGIVGFELTYIEGSEAFTTADGGVEVFGQFTVLYDDDTTGIADDFAFLVDPDQESVAEFDVVETDVVVLIEEFLAADSEGSDGETFSSDVAIEDSALASEEVYEVADMVDQLLADSAISDETLSEYQQEVEQSIDDSLADVSFDLTVEPTADSIVALEAAAFEVADAASDGIDTAFDAVDDSSYTI